MSLQVSGLSMQSCAPMAGQPQTQGKAVAMGLPGALFPAEPGAGPAFEA